MIIFLVASYFITLVGADVCEPYEQLEEKLKCGESGYLLHYGLRNCRKFNSFETRNLFSPAGQQFINCTTGCLLRFLSGFEQDPTATCSSVSKEAFNSHTECYISCDFCRICKTDKRALWKTYSLRDFFSFRAMRQVIQVAASCSYFGFSCLF